MKEAVVHGVQVQMQMPSSFGSPNKFYEGIRKH
jgi:hypothetical protein